MSRLSGRIKRFLSRKPEYAYKWLYLIVGSVLMFSAALQLTVWGLSGPTPYGVMTAGLLLVASRLSAFLPARRHRLIVTLRTVELVLAIVTPVLLALGLYSLLR